MHTGFVDKGYEESIWLRAGVLKLENVEEKCSIFCASESKLIIRRVYGITFSLSLSVSITTWKDKALQRGSACNICKK